MLKLVKAGLYILFIGTAMELIYHSSPYTYRGLFDAIFGPGGLYAHIVTAIGMVMSMFVLWRAPEKRTRIKRIN